MFQIPTSLSLECPITPLVHRSPFLACLLVARSLITSSSAPQHTYYHYFFKYTSHLAFPGSLTTLCVLQRQRLSSLCLAHLVWQHPAQSEFSENSCWWWCYVAREFSILLMLVVLFSLHLSLLQMEATVHGLNYVSAVSFFVSFPLFSFDFLFVYHV